MSGKNQMTWHAYVSARSAPIQKSILWAVLAPVALISGMFAFMNGYYHGVLEGLKAFALFVGVCVVLFGFSWLVVLAIRPKGIRTGFIMNETGIYSFTDDAAAQQIIAAGGAMGVATSNPTLAATPLAAAAGKVGHVKWSDMSSFIERPSKNCFDLRRGRKSVYIVYANQDNYVDIRSFIKRHIAQAKRD